MNYKMTRVEFQNAVKQWKGKVVELKKDYALVGDKNSYTIKIDIDFNSFDEIIIKGATLQKEDHMFAWHGLKDELKRVSDLNS